MLAPPSLDLLKILIVDDQDFVRAVVRKMLTQIGIATVVEARDGIEALRQVAEQRPDLVICDVRMRPLDGFGFVEALRGQPGGAALPVILLTGQADPTVVERANAAGIDALLLKPVLAPALQDRILAVLSARRPAATP
ncbi:response regulator [Phaeospirillum tilakii]|uniref:Response regulator n=1 Tax=Phaeospirillum tilakii TaxID=741673 RepID=A0ABW5CAN0_9PROT